MLSCALSAELRKGPRGGGRERDKIASHVIDVERAYARKIGVHHKPFLFGDLASLAAMREQIATGEVCEMLLLSGSKCPWQ